MKIIFSKRNKETGEREEIFTLDDKKIKEYLVKAGTFVLINGLMGKVFPAKRNAGVLINAGISAGATKLIFDRIKSDPNAEDEKSTNDGNYIDITEQESSSDDDLK